MHIRFYIDGPSPCRDSSLIVDPFVSLLVAPPSLVLGKLHRPFHSYPGFKWRGSYSQQPFSRCSSRRETHCHGFYDSKRYIRRRPLLTIWQGISIIASRYVLISIRNSVLFCIQCSRACRGVSGTYYSAHFFKFQARLSFIMYAQLLTRLSTGVFRACTPPLSCATRFSFSIFLSPSAGLICRHLAVIGDVVEVALLLTYSHFSLLDVHFLAQLYQSLSLSQATGR